MVVGTAVQHCHPALKRGQMVGFMWILLQLENRTDPDSWLEFGHSTQTGTLHQIAGRCRVPERLPPALPPMPPLFVVGGHQQPSVFARGAACAFLSLGHRPSRRVDGSQDSGV